VVGAQKGFHMKEIDFKSRSLARRTRESGSGSLLSRDEAEIVKLRPQSRSEILYRGIKRSIVIGRRKEGTGVLDCLGEQAHQ
jgi:hypothetical protein